MGLRKPFFRIALSLAPSNQLRIRVSILANLKLPWVSLAHSLSHWGGLCRQSWFLLHSFELFPVKTKFYVEFLLRLPLEQQAWYNSSLRTVQYLEKKRLVYRSMFARMACVWALLLRAACVRSCGRGHKCGLHIPACGARDTELYDFKNILSLQNQHQTPQLINSPKLAAFSVSACGDGEGKIVPNLRMEIFKFLHSGPPNIGTGRPSHEIQAFHPPPGLSPACHISWCPQGLHGIHVFFKSQRL
jgi:hypothetical protein